MKSVAKEIAVIAIVRARAGHERELADILSAAVAPSRAEAGCRQYDLHEDRDAPGRFVFVERWASSEALKAHEETEHFRQLGQCLLPHIEGKSEVIVLERLR